MKILLFITSLNGGGAQRIVQLLSRQMTSLGHEITVASLDHGPPVYRFSKKATIVHFRTGVLNQGFLKILCLPLQAVELVIRIRQLKPDATISFLVRANLVNALSKFLMGQRKIIISHRNITQGLYGNAGLKGRIMLWLIEKLYPRADRIIAISKDVKTSLERVGVDPSKMEVIHNFIDSRVIDGSKGPALPVSLGKPVIISVGRLVEQKDFSSLLRAFAIVRSTLDARLVIIGEGPLRQQLERLAGQLKVAGDVLFTGWLANPFGVIRQGSVFVLCSRYEGFGNVIVEAMACGLPIICTNSPGGPAEILGNGAFGKLVGCGEVHEIADSIMGVLMDPGVQQKMRRLSLLRANAYRIENLAPRYLEGIDACSAPQLLPSPKV